MNSVQLCALHNVQCRSRPFGASRRKVLIMSKSQTAATAERKPGRSASRRFWKASAAGAAGALLGGAALLNRRNALQAEKAYPPLGDFLHVGGVRLHYVERGSGAPIVLLHGNGTMIQDWIVSGLLDELAKTHRVIAFDRPGFGHSSRPRSTIWTPAAQAALFAEAFEKLGLEKPLVAAHSFGAMVALALAARHPESVSGLVLIGGYYYPSARADVLFASQPAIPVIGDIMRYTVSPILGAALTPRINEKIFRPAPVPERWLAEFPFELMLRPSQIRAEAAEAAVMIPAAAELQQSYGALRLPVMIIAGDGDAIVTTSSQAERLHREIPHSRLLVVKGAGHMVHHMGARQIAEALGPD